MVQPQHLATRLTAGHAAKHPQGTLWGSTLNLGMPLPNTSCCCRLHHNCRKLWISLFSACTYFVLMRVSAPVAAPAAPAAGPERFLPAASCRTARKD